MEAEKTEMIFAIVVLFLIVIGLSVSYLSVLFKYRCIKKRYGNLRAGFKMVLNQVEDNQVEVKDREKYLKL